MTVRTFALALIPLGILLFVFGWQSTSPAAFIGPVLVLLGAVLMATRGRHGR
jgi:hypothetical protein